MMEYMNKNRVKKIIWITFLVLTGIGLLNSSMAYLAALAAHDDVPYSKTFIWEMTGAYSVIPILPLFYWYARRFPFRPAYWVRSLVVHLFGIVGYAMLHTFGMWFSRMLIYHLLGWGSYDYGIIFFRYLMELHKDVFSYCLFLSLLGFFDYLMANRERALQSARLASQLSQARLEALRMQLDPHFLFNTLNAISSYMYEDVRIADKMMANLSRLLRLSLDYSDTQVVPFREELAFLKLYLSIMKARFQDKLEVELDVAQDTRDALLPNLILQPLVENAIKHNQPTVGKVAHIHMKARKEEATLVLDIEDNGPGFKEQKEEMMEKGVGLANTIQRLEQLYGSAHNLTFTNREQGGLSIHLVLPFRQEPDVGGERADTGDAEVTS